MKSSPLSLIKKYIPSGIDVTRLQKAALKVKANPRSEQAKNNLLSELSPLLRTLLRVLRGKELKNDFDAFEKARIEKTIGSNGYEALEAFTKDPAWSDEDVYQTLVLESLRLVNIYRPVATFSTFITRYLRWKIAYLISSTVQLKTHAILYKEYTYKFYGDVTVFINRSHGWQLQLLSYLVDELSVRDLEDLTCYSKTNIHDEILQIRSNLEL